MKEYDLKAVLLNTIEQEKRLIDESRGKINLALALINTIEQQQITCQVPSNEDKEPISD